MELRLCLWRLAAAFILHPGSEWNDSRVTKHYDPRDSFCDDNWYCARSCRKRRAIGVFKHRHGEYLGIATFTIITTSADR